MWWSRFSIIFGICVSLLILSVGVHGFCLLSANKKNDLLVYFSTILIDFFLMLFLFVSVIGCSISILIDLFG